MESSIKYYDEALTLVDDYMDIGYMAENIEVEDINQVTKTIKRSHSDKSMTLLVSLPNTESSFVQDLQRLDTLMSAIVVDIHCYILFDSVKDEIINGLEGLKKFEVVFDKEDDFGEMYGCKIIDGSLKNRLTKSLFLISKDGAIFYIEMPENLEQPFNLEKLQVELNKAYTSYTGVGCHG